MVAQKVVPKRIKKVVEKLKPVKKKTSRKITITDIGIATARGNQYSRAYPGSASRMVVTPERLLAFSTPGTKERAYMAKAIRLYRKKKHRTLEGAIVTPLAVRRKRVGSVLIVRYGAKPIPELIKP